MREQSWVWSSSGVFLLCVVCKHWCWGIALSQFMPTSKLSHWRFSLGLEKLLFKEAIMLNLYESFPNSTAVLANLFRQSKSF